MAFYKDKIEHLCEMNAKQAEQIESLKASQTKYKDRYTKLCRLLQDSECKLHYRNLSNNCPE